MHVSKYHHMTYEWPIAQNTSIIGKRTISCSRIALYILYMWMCILHQISIHVLVSNRSCHYNSTDGNQYKFIPSTLRPLLPYSGKLSREKTFTNFAVLEPSTEVFSTKFGRAVPTMIGFSILRKFSLWNGHFLPICESFLPRKFPATQYITPRAKDT